MHQLLRTTVAVFSMLASGAYAQTVSLQTAAAALGADRVSAIEFSGAGKWYRFGQPPVPGKGWPQHDVSSFTTTIDFASVAERVVMVRAESKSARQRPPLVQNVEEFVSGNYAWNTTLPAGGRPGAQRVPQPQPAEHDTRLIDIWATPQGFVKAAIAQKARTVIKADGADIYFSLGTMRFEGHLNPQGQVQTVRTWLADPVLGDMEIAYAYSGYRDFSGLPFPAHIVRTQGGFPVWELNIATAKAGTSVAITVPDPVRAYRPPAPRVDILQLSEGVYEFSGDNYNSVAIEQSNRVVVVEAPLNEARSLDVIAKIRTLIPGKPIRYVVNTHTHFDHSGGLRTYAAIGATIVTNAANRPFYETVWRTPRRLQPDRLSQSHKKPTFETFTGKHVIPDTLRPIEIYPVTGSGHADGFAMVYLPAEKFLIEADAFNMPPAGSRPPATPNPYNVNLFENIKGLKLEVRLIVPLHGAIGHMPDLRNAIGNAVLSQKPRGCQDEAFYC